MFSMALVLISPAQWSDRITTGCVHCLVCIWLAGWRQVDG